MEVALLLVVSRARVLRAVLVQVIVGLPVELVVVEAPQAPVVSVSYNY